MSKARYVIQDAEVSDVQNLCFSTHAGKCQCGWDMGIIHLGLQSSNLCTTKTDL